MDHITRMKQERNELKDKLDKLSEFIFKSEIFKSLDMEKQVLMVKQHAFMTSYLETLDARLFLEYK